MDYMIWPDGDEMVLVKNDTQPSGPLFTPESIMGLIWQENWESKKLAELEPAEIQTEYVRFCRYYKINAPCWAPIGPYPVPKPKSVLETQPNDDFEIIMDESQVDHTVEDLLTIRAAELASGPPAPRKGPRPYSFDDLDLLPVKRRLFV